LLHSTTDPPQSQEAFFTCDSVERIEHTCVATTLSRRQSSHTDKV